MQLLLAIKSEQGEKSITFDPANELLPYRPKPTVPSLLIPSVSPSPSSVTGHPSQLSLALTFRPSK